MSPHTCLYRKTKIIATIGPASSSPVVLERLIAAGVNVIRLNLSHGKLEEHSAVIKLVREVSEKLDLHVAVLVDLQGPRIRTGTLKGGAVEVMAGDKISIVPEGGSPEGLFITTTYAELSGDVKPGDRVLIDDGLIELRVSGVSGSTVYAEAVYGGIIKEHKGMNLPGVDVSTPSLTEKDLEGIDMGVAGDVDYFALSFVRKASDVEGLKEILREKGADIPVIAKIERAEAIESLEPILKVSDGIMIARGDLGVELGAEKVPVLQKKIITEANESDKLVITATQMLESMIKSPRPTRAEASDVANAVFDGTDALMLSGETAVGAYPAKTIEMMVRIIKEAEGAVHYNRTAPAGKGVFAESFSRAVSFAAVAASREIDSRAIVVFTQTGDSAIMLSKLRPSTPVIAFTPLAKTCRRLALAWGVRPFATVLGSHTDEMICRGEAALLDLGVAEWGDKVVIVSGTKVGMRGATNMMKIDWIGSEECRIYLKGPNE